MRAYDARQSMTTSIDSPFPDGGSDAGRATDWFDDGRAAQAFRRVSHVGLLLGFVGLVSFVPVFVRLIESWRVSSRVASHHVSVLGIRLSYPAANAGAVIVLALALLGAVVTATAVLSLARELHAARRLARRLAQLAPMRRGGVFVIDDESPEAFCAGLLRPRVYVTSGALAALDQPAVDALLQHEREHAARRDPLRLAASRVMERSLFFMPALRELRRGQQLLAELSADESAVRAAAGDRSGLASAMLSFSEVSRPGGFSGVEPARVEFLLGESLDWRFPAIACTGALAVLAILVTLAILAGREASGSATLAPPFLSAQPCIVMLALVPAVVGLVVVRLGRIASRRSRESGS